MRGDAPFAGVEAEHHLAERHQVVPALVAGRTRAARSSGASIAVARAALDPGEVAARGSAAGRRSSCRRRRPRPGRRGTTPSELGVDPAGREEPRLGKVAETARRNAGPPSVAAGKTLTSCSRAGVRARARRAWRSPGRTAARARRRRRRPRRPSRSDGERGPGCRRGARLLDGQHRPGAHHHPLDLRRRDRAAAAPRPEGDLDGGDASRQQSRAQVGDDARRRRARRQAAPGPPRAPRHRAASLTGRASRRRREGRRRARSRPPASRGRPRLPRCPRARPSGRPGSGRGSARNAPDRRGSACVLSVRTYPGATALTLTPWGAHSFASAFVSPATPDLLAV